MAQRTIGMVKQFVANKKHGERFDVYIGRPSKFGNPFVIGRDGDRREVVAKFEAYLLANPELLAAVKRELRGKVLGCFCCPELCHGHVLAWYANVHETPESREETPTSGLKVIVAGSRVVNDAALVAQAIADSSFEIAEIVSGTARGVDQLGEAWARQHGVAVRRFPADWERHGKSAGFKRNEEMARYADALVAIWDGVSPGTSHMIGLARKYRLQVYVVSAVAPDACCVSCGRLLTGDERNPRWFSGLCDDCDTLRLEAAS